MIRTAADILAALMQREASKLDGADITHAPTIGAMYEGLAKDIVERSVPKDLGLRVVDGFVIDGHGNQTGQIDCMLVSGDGVPVPYVPGSYQWHVKDVIAVFETKKNLFGADLEDSFSHLRGVADNYSNWVQGGGTETFNLRASYRMYAEVTGQVAPPPDQWKNMPTDQHLIFHTIMRDQISPLRFIFGFSGYTTEQGLRKGLIAYLESNIEKQGFGP